MLPWQHLLPGVAEKLISCSLCRGMESKEPIKIFTSPRNKKSVAMATLVTRCCRKTNQLKSMQGFGMQRYLRKIFKPKKHKKSVAMGTLVARCCRKTNQLQSVQGYRKQRTHKNIYKSKKQKKSVEVCQKTNQLQSVQGYGKQRTHKIFISPRNRKKCCHGNTCCQLSL